MYLFFLIVLFTNTCLCYQWNNSILQLPPWPIDNCEPIGSDCHLFDLVDASVCTNLHCKINVAVILPDSLSYIVSLNKSTEILEKAAEEVKTRFGIGNRLTFNFSKFDDECRQEYGTVRMIQAIEAQANVVFGSICEYSLASIGRVGKYVGNAGIPALTPGGFIFDFTKRKQSCTDEFFMVINTGVLDFRSFSEFFHLIMNRYKWKKVALMYDKTEQVALGGENTCQFILMSVLEDIKSNNDLDYHDGDLLLLRMSHEEYIKKIIGTHYAIVLTCTSSSKMRDFAIVAQELNLMESGEYTVFNFETFSNSTDPLRPWFDPLDSEDNNEKARKGFKSIYTFRSSHDVKKNDGSIGDFYLDSLYDGMLLYGHALSKTIKEPTSNKSIKGTDIVRNMMGTTFEGSQNETITMNCNGQRVAEYLLVHTNEQGEYETVAKYTTFNKTIIYWKDAWINGDPQDTPVCGYDMSLCPKFDTVKVLIITLVLVLCLGILIVSIMLYRHFKLKNAIYSMAWKVDHDDIIFVPTKARSSFQSTISICKGSQLIHMEADGLSMAGDRHLFTTVGFYKANRVAVKYFQDVKLELNHDQLKELKSMKDLSHDNLVKFFGASLEIPNCVLSEYCAKGSLQDILENENVQLDTDFKMSLIMDVVRGMTYLHTSDIKSHGALKSTNCLVDSRFVLKITDFGLHFLRKYSSEAEDSKESSHSFWERQLWTAPELLRIDSPPPEGTPKGDIYSFAFIMHEIIVRKGVFHLENFSTAKEKVDAVRRGPDANGGQPFRPSLGEALCDEEVTQIMKKCWAEDAADRPDFVTLKSKFRNINKQSDGNLLDNLLARMEQYANNLESLVEERTADYLEEKRKCEELLYQLLPKSVAQQLIIGQSVIAETFEHVTIHFSDIVGFTAMSATSTPLQVVDFLNELYTCFDSIIENYDVYKVETIGDSYMVVSGLPDRNGNKHAREIARMSLALLKAVKTFKIRHREDITLKLRIGIHTGPCVAGVVGLKMPRYCLFGDTVNTASRMETNGLPLRVHISPVTKEFLDKFGTFDIERRGEVELKGKGKMVTYWLNGEHEEPSAEPAKLNESKGVKLPCTPLPATVRKQMASNGNGKELNEMYAQDHRRDEADVPLLSITSPPEYNSNA